VIEDDWHIQSVLDFKGELNGGIKVLVVMSKGVREVRGLFMHGNLKNA